MHGQVSISILIQIPITCTKKIQLALRVRMDHQYFLDVATQKKGTKMPFLKIHVLKIFGSRFALALLTNNMKFGMWPQINESKQLEIYATIYVKRLNIGRPPPPRRKWSSKPINTGAFFLIFMYYKFSARASRSHNSSTILNLKCGHR